MNIIYFIGNSERQASNILFIHPFYLSNSNTRQPFSNMSPPYFTNDFSIGPLSSSSSQWTNFSLHQSAAYSFIDFIMSHVKARSLFVAEKNFLVFLRLKVSPAQIFGFISDMITPKLLKSSRGVLAVKEFCIFNHFKAAEFFYLMIIFRKEDFIFAFILCLLFCSVILSVLHICYFITLFIYISDSACWSTRFSTWETGEWFSIFVLISSPPADYLCDNWSFCYKNLGWTILATNFGTFQLLSFLCLIFSSELSFLILFENTSIHSLSYFNSLNDLIPTV